MTRSPIRCLSLCWIAASFVAAFVAADEAVDFHDDIFPFLEARCFKCHSDEKQKGDLRLDSPAWIMRGSENGDVLSPGNPDDSPMYYLTTYDEDDPDYMPSKGKGLSAAEKELLKRWIDSGADFGEGMASMMAMSSMVPSSSAVGEKYTDDVPLPPATYELPQTLAATVAHLEAMGLLVDTVNHDAASLEVSFTYAEAGEAYDLSVLQPVAGAVVKLNFGRSQVADSHFVELAAFENVTHLDLRNTAITDAALEAVGKLESLEYLNLFGTSVSDAGLAQLGGLKRLRNVYLHGTEVTSEGVERLGKAIPGVRVVR